MLSTISPLTKRRVLCLLIIPVCHLVGCGGNNPIDDVPILTTITIEPPQKQPVAGITTTVQLTARGLDQHKKALPLSQLTWNSSETTTASINNNGLVTILNAGTVTISATADGITGTFLLAILPPPSFEVFISSRANNSVKRYHGDTGTFIDDFVTSGSGGLSLTQEVAFGPDGHLYVSGRGNTTILKYDKTTGSFIGNFTSGYNLDEPTKMTFGPNGYLYVSQWGQSKNKIARFNSQTGAFVDEITTGLNLGMDHAWDENGNLYIVSFGSRDVRKFDPLGNFINVFTSGGHLQGPVNLWFGTDRNLYVVDWESGTIQIFNGTTGAYNKDFITGITRAEGFAFDNIGNLYVCDWVQNVVRYYDGKTGEIISTPFTSGSLIQPNSIALRYR